MKLLLDSHFLLWWLMEDKALGKKAEALIAAPENTIFASAVSMWELRIKQSIGKLSLPRQFRSVLDSQGFESLPFTADHAHALAELPMHHRDPFDRALIAQARTDRLTFVTRDAVAERYSVDVVIA